MIFPQKITQRLTLKREQDPLVEEIRSQIMMQNETRRKYFLSTGKEKK